MKKGEEGITEDQLAGNWIARMAAGEPEALDALYRVYHRPLLAIFNRILSDRFTAEEVLQDTFVRAYRNAHHFDPRVGSPFAWLVTIGKRLAIDRLRRRQSRPDTQNWEQPETIGDNREQGRKADAQLEWDWMAGALDGLPPRQRKAIELAFLYGYTHYEVAQIQDCPIGTVKSDLHRGLAHLRKAYLEGND